MGSYGMSLPQCESLESRLNKIKNDLEQCRKAVRMAAKHIEHAGGYGLRGVHERLMDTSRDIGKYNDLAQDLRSCLIEAETITRKCEKDVYKKITYDWRDVVKGFFKVSGKIIGYAAKACKIDKIVTWAGKLKFIKDLDIDFKSLGKKLGALAKSVSIVKCFWDNVIINREGNNIFRALAETVAETAVSIATGAAVKFALTGLATVIIGATPVGWAAVAVAAGCVAAGWALDYGAKKWTKGKSDGFDEMVGDFILDNTQRQWEKAKENPVRYIADRAVPCGGSIAAWAFQKQ